MGPTVIRCWISDMGIDGLVPEGSTVTLPVFKGQLAQKFGKAGQASPLAQPRILSPWNSSSRLGNAGACSKHGGERHVPL